MTSRFLLPRKLILLLSFFLIALSACASAPTPTPFIPPTDQAPLIEPQFIITPTPASTNRQVIPLPSLIPTADQTDCTNNLSFVEDLTIPDNSFVAFGEKIVKEWLVKNSGTCHWTAAYRLKHTGGAVLEAPEEFALYPAKADTQAAIRIIFTAPFTEGVYESQWQAFDPSGLPFGDPIYMKIVVTP